jgi:hypothetical protein
MPVELDEPSVVGNNPEDELSTIPIVVPVEVDTPLAAVVPLESSPSTPEELDELATASVSIEPELKITSFRPHPTDVNAVTSVSPTTHAAVRAIAGPSVAGPPSCGKAWGPPVVGAPREISVSSDARYACGGATPARVAPRP